MRRTRWSVLGPYPTSSWNRAAQVAIAERDLAARLGHGQAAGEQRRRVPDKRVGR
jgi:hypothetical protein